MIAKSAFDIFFKALHLNAKMKRPHVFPPGPNSKVIRRRHVSMIRNKIKI